MPEMRVGKILGMNKSNVMNLIKKSSQRTAEKESTTVVNVLEVDELYWYLKHKPRTGTRENIYIMTMVSRKPRQIMGHVVS